MKPLHCQVRCCHKRFVCSNDHTKGGLVDSVVQAKLQEFGWQRNWNAEFCSALELENPTERVKAAETLWEGERY
jgi:hypothetical protein